jgi:hypothetical protein
MNGAQISSLIRNVHPRFAHFISSSLGTKRLFAKMLSLWRSSTTFHWRVADIHDACFALVALIYQWQKFYCSNQFPRFIRNSSVIISWVVFHGTFCAQPVRIRVRIGPPHPHAHHKRRLNGAVFILLSTGSRQIADKMMKNRSCGSKQTNKNQRDQKQTNNQ